MTGDWREDGIATAPAGNPTVLRRWDAGSAVIGNPQFLPGCAVLLVDAPGVQRLSELPRDRRTAFTRNTGSVESTPTVLQSMRPGESASAGTARRTLSQVPSADHRRWRSSRVFQLPDRSGGSRHETPVRTRNGIPLTAVR